MKWCGDLVLLLLGHYMLSRRSTATTTLAQCIQQHLGWLMFTIKQYRCYSPALHVATSVPSFPKLKRIHNVAVWSQYRELRTPRMCPWPNILISQSHANSIRVYIHIHSPRRRKLPHIQVTQVLGRMCLMRPGLREKVMWEESEAHNLAGCKNTALIWYTKNRRWMIEICRQAKPTAKMLNIVD